MSKRKRGELSLDDKLDKHCNEVFRALKSAKGFERQRLSKRLREDGIGPDKKERLEREVTVLKSLDLHQTARAHLYSSIVKVKTLAECPKLPEEIRTGVPKPELSPDEQAALHNVTSGLYNREPVKQAVDRAVTAVCQALNVPLPEKAKRSRKSKREEKEEQPSDRIEKAPKVEEKPLEEDVLASVEEEEEGDYDEESEFEGFSDVGAPAQEAGEVDSEDEDEEEKELSKYDHLLGGSSDEDEDEDDFDDERFAQFKGKEKVNLDDISVSGSDAEPELDSDSDSEPEVRKQPSISLSPSPPPAKKKKKDKTAPARPRDSTFLPSLMGGYISGSESASDVDVAPAKKRRGQRQRQAIWEKKFGAKAKHLQQPAKGRRDSGWDMKRGAVDGDEQRTPWKKGIRNPLTRQAADSKPEVQRPPTKKDDEGPLHPSWAARKQAKASEKTATFAGSKITFD
ncbi:hypothetical protein ACHAPT_001094 [Fusarium lateritium]